MKLLVVIIISLGDKLSVHTINGVGTGVSAWVIQSPPRGIPTHGLGWGWEQDLGVLPLLSVALMKPPLPEGFTIATLRLYQFE